MILVPGDLSGMKAQERSALIIKAAEDSEAEHMKHQHNLGPCSYKQAVGSIRRKIHQDHFKADRVGKLKDNVHNKKSSNKKLNATQKSSGVDQTAEMLGLIPYSSINKNKGHTMPLKEELIFRGVEFDEEKVGFMELKKLLINHELERMKSSGDGAMAAAKKNFQRLSNTIFVGVDIDRRPADFVLAEDIH